MRNPAPSAPGVAKKQTESKRKPAGFTLQALDDAAVADALAWAETGAEASVCATDALSSAAPAAEHAKENSEAEPLRVPFKGRITSIAQACCAFLSFAGGFAALILFVSAC